ncbi:MAG: L-2-hydroxyglutarate oxidase [Sedimentisphaerales bacterium]|nr:L-2-hydroxyglutarate oxidase [Sedimentisphaerales bacterium]
MSDYDYDITVIGGGIVGLAAAYKISQRLPKLSVAVLEKESTLAYHQTGHNSGVIHSGLYYKPGSVKAKTCTDGRKQLVAFAQEHSIPHDICGKIIVAADEKQLPQLNNVYQNGLDNGIEGLERIKPERIKQIEPYCGGIDGLYVPCTGVIDFVKVAQKLAGLIKTEGENDVRTSCKVTGFERNGQVVHIITNKNKIKTRFVINCAGLHSDRIAKLAGVKAPMYIGVRIVPFRGDYFDLTAEAAQKVKKLIYPVPDPKFPFLGVHFTRTIDGKVECGPNAVFSLKREGYGKFSFSFKDTWQSLIFPGTLIMFAKNMSCGLGEYTRAFCKKLTVRQLRKLLPSITGSDLIPGKSGVRAQAVRANGEIIDDFEIVATDNMIHVLNAPSPAATASLAIADHITQTAVENFNV